MQNDNPNSEPKLDAAAGAKEPSRPRWHWLYYVLAAFDLLTVAMALILNHQTRDIFARSVEVNNVWNQRRAQYSQLGELADAVNMPGNDVFGTLDVEGERTRMRTALRTFEERMAAVRAETRTNLPADQADRVVARLDAMASATAEMAAEAEMIFNYLARDMPEQAGRQMASMDRTYTQVLIALRELRREAAIIEQDALVQQQATAAWLSNFEYAIAAGIILMIGAATFYGRSLARQMEADARERQRLYEALAKRERQLQDLVGRLILSQEEERRRVAYNLHDGLAQTAAGAHMHLRGFARRYQAHLPEAREELDRAVELAQRVVREARGVVAELRPTALDDLGLEAALEAEIEELRKEGWQVEYEADLGPDRLAPAVETALFRVAQEALRNARKHAGAERARVALRRSDRAVHLEVQDWGRGFDPARLPEGGGPGERIGLSGMRERVALLGGQCEVHSRPGAGTRVVAEVPLQAPVDEVAIGVT
jgi:signal transduction histidine kinase